MGGQWGAKAFVASRARGQQPKDFPQAEALRAGQLVNQASGAMPLQMKGAIQRLAIAIGGRCWSLG